MANSNLNIQKDLSERIDRLIIDDPDEQTLGAELRRIGDEAARYAKDQKDANLWHLAALAWYEHPDRSSHRSKRIYFCENRALEIDPKHQFARQYLAYHQFDEGKYGDALRNLEQLRADYFEALGQYWRVLKNRELVLAGRLHLKQHIPLQEFESLFNDYASAADNCDDPVPLELANTFVTLIESGEKVDPEILESFRVTVRELKSENALREQLGRLGGAAI